MSSYEWVCDRCRGTRATSSERSYVLEFAEKHYRLAHGPYAFAAKLIEPPKLATRLRPMSRPERLRWSKIMRHPLVMEGDL